MFNKLKQTQAFTLIELLVVIAIIGVLASVVISSLSSARSKARDAKRISDVRQIQTALEMYFADNGYYPEFTSLNSRCNTRSAGENSLSSLVSQGFLPLIPNDPINTLSTPSYCYEYIGLGDLSSYPSASTWSCGGRSRTDYQYTLIFSLEKQSSNYALLTGGSSYNHCIHGDLK